MMNLMSPNKSSQDTAPSGRGFTLLEVICALGILSIIASSAMVIMARNRDSSYNVTMRLRALEVARENMEEMLIAETIEEQTEFGFSEKYPSIEWENTIETFFAPMEGQTWARAIAIARYEDIDDDNDGDEDMDDLAAVKEIKLEHWLCRVTDAEMDALDQLEGTQSGLLESIAEAAEFAGVDEEVVKMWLENGMIQTEEGYFIEANLSLFKRTEGNPSVEELAQQAVTGVFDDMPNEDIPVDPESADVPAQDVLGERRGL